MSNRNLKIREPAFAEHKLICDSAPVPQLSADFKSRVMADCSSSILAAQRVFRFKIIAGLTVACCLTAVICLTVPEASDVVVPVVDQPSTPKATPTPTQPPHISPGMSSNAAGLAVDKARPAFNSESEKQQVNEIIETLNDRKKMFNANMLPQF